MRIEYVIILSIIFSLFQRFFHKPDYSEKHSIGSMNKLRFLALLSISILLFGIAVERSYHFITDGFSIHRISHSEPPPCPFNEVVLWDEESIEEVNKALRQDFYYLNSGSQCFVFSSADNQYVLKFFKHHRWRFTALSQALLSPSFCKKLREKKRSRKYMSYLDTCRSYCLSFEQFKDKTGLLFVHLSTNNRGLPTVTITDQIYRKYHLPLDNFTFLLQRKATPIGQYITECNEDESKIRFLISKYLTFIEERARLGYLNKDPNFAKNFGVFNNSIIEIDIGGCFHDPKKDLHYFYSQELTRMEEKLCNLFKKNRSLCTFIREEIERRRNDFSSG